MFVGAIYVDTVNQLLYVLIFIPEWHFISKKTDPGQLHEISVCKDLLVDLFHTETKTFPSQNNPQVEITFECHGNLSYIKYLVYSCCQL